MRLSKPRVSPLDDSQLDGDQQAALAPFRLSSLVNDTPGSVLNIFRTLAHAPEALVRFNAWGSYILSRRNALSPRQREILILRTGFLCRSGYEWSQHHRIGLQSGLGADDIERIKGGAGDGWGPAEAALIRAADGLHADQFIDDVTWAELGAHFTQKQCMDVVFTCAQYTQVSMILNTFGVQLEDGATLDPDLKAC